MVFDYFGRCRRLRSAFARLSLDSLLISKKENIYYLSGFTGDDSLLLITGDQSFLITDFRYREQAEKELFPG
jgi:Xaa-Pro aminopeptidase